MKITPVPIAIALLLACGTSAYAQTGAPAILVAGSPVALSRPAERTGGEWFVPLAPIARALNVELQVTATGLMARTSGGVETQYDARTGEIRFRQVVIGRVSQHGQFVVAAPVETLLFPLNGVVALLGVDVYEEFDRNVIRIEPSGTADGFKAPTFMIGDADFVAGMTASAGTLAHHTMLRATAASGGVSLTSNVVLSGAGRDVAMRQGLVEAAFAGDRRAGFGDQGSRTAVDALMTSFRGVSYRGTIGAQFEAEAYGGRAVGTTRAAVAGAPAVASFDSQAAGLNLRRRIGGGDLSLATQWFDGQERSGVSAGAAFINITRRNQLKVQTVFGRYTGLGARTALTPQSAADHDEFSTGSIDPPNPSQRIPVDGAGFGVSVLNTYTPIDRLSLTAQADRYSRNMLTAREDAQFNAQFSRRVSATFQPISHVNVFAGAAQRVLLLGPPGTLAVRNHGGTLQVPGTRIRLGYLRSRQQDDVTVGLGRLDLTQYSLTIPTVRQYAGTASYAEMRSGDAVTRTFSGTVSKDLGARGRLSVAEQWQPGSSQRLAIEWQRDGFPGIGGFVHIGMEQVFHLQTRQLAVAPVGSLGVRLPHGQRLQMSVFGDHGSRTFSVAVSGPLSWRREEKRDSGRLAVEPAAVLAGRVYFDVDNDGVFRAGTDEGVGEITVWLDDDRSSTTDADGSFQFSELQPGSHSLRAELDGVPADLVFAEMSERTVAVLPYGRNAHEFRVVRTGSVTAQVSVLEETGSQDKPVARPLPEVRVVANAEVDSFTDINGMVLFGALSPGTYDFAISPETLPAGYVAMPGLTRVEIRPGETAPRLQFVLAPAPKDVITRTLAPQQAAVTAGQ